MSRVSCKPVKNLPNNSSYIEFQFVVNMTAHSYTNMNCVRTCELNIKSEFSLASPLPFKWFQNSIRSFGQSCGHFILPPLRFSLINIVYIVIQNGKQLWSITWIIISLLYWIWNNATMFRDRKISFHVLWFYGIWHTHLNIAQHSHRFGANI